MSYKTCRRIVIFILFLFFHSLYAITLPDENLKPDLNEIINEDNTYHESSFRRAEIVFFLSLPFVFLAHATVAGTAYVLSDPNNNFDVKEFPPELIHFVAFSSVFTSGVIAYFDYKQHQLTDNDISQDTLLRFGVRAPF